MNHAMATVYEKTEGEEFGSTARLDERSLHIRRTILEKLGASRSGAHIPAAFSIIEILRVLYERIATFEHTGLEQVSPNRDRVILSKGHGCLALYALLQERGVLSEDALADFGGWGARLGGHPERDVGSGIEATTGSLGHGLPLGVGMALASRITSSTFRVFVLCGDGEMNEGSTWEAAFHAVKHRLGGLILLVDCNGQQCFGATRTVVPGFELGRLLAATGFRVATADGHDLDELEVALQAALKDDSRPSAILCRTVKGRGLKRMENDPRWHYQACLTAADLAALATELDPDHA